MPIYFRTDYSVRDGGQNPHLNPCFVQMMLGLLNVNLSVF